MSLRRALEVGEPCRLRVPGADGRATWVYGRRLGDPASPVKRLLLHGVGLTWATWRQVLPRLAASGDCLAIDLAGFGRSRAAYPWEVTMAAQGRLIPEILDALRWPAATLVGHSMGGGSALGAAMLRPRRVRRLVLVGSVAFAQAPPPGFQLTRLPGAGTALAMIARLGCRLGAPLVMHRQFGYDLPAATDMLRQWRKLPVAWAFTRAVRDLTPEMYHRYGHLFSTIQTPTLIVHGRRDHIVPPRIPARLHTVLGQSELLWLPCGHMPQESCPEEVAAAITRFDTPLDAPASPT